MNAQQSGSALLDGAAGGGPGVVKLQRLLDQRPELGPDFLARDAIVPALTAATKEGVIREMVEALRAAGQVRGADTEALVEAILKRERYGTTGIGRGVAIPHAKHKSVGRVLGTLAVSHPGVPFESVDRQPVYVFALVLSPEGQFGSHLRALEAISRCLGDDPFVRSLRAAAAGGR